MDPEYTQQILRAVRRRFPSEALSAISDLSRHLHGLIVGKKHDAAELLSAIEAAPTFATLCQNFQAAIRPNKSSTPDSVDGVTRQLESLVVSSSAEAPSRPSLPKPQIIEKSFKKSEPAPRDSAAPPRSPKPCLYFRTAAGCHKRDKCKFAHVKPSSPQQGSRSLPSTPAKPRDPFVFNHVGGVRRWLSEINSLPDGTDLLSRLLAFDAGRLEDFLKFGGWAKTNQPIDDVFDTFLTIINRSDMRHPLYKEPFNALFTQLHVAKPLWDQLENLVQRCRAVHESRINKIISTCETLLDLFSESARTLSSIVEALEERVETGFPKTMSDRVERLVQRRKDARKLAEKQREQIDRQQSTSSSASASQLVDQETHLGFRHVSVIPDGTSFLEDMPKRLQPNRMDGSEWAGLDDYLATHFHLLREDALRPLWDSLGAVADGKGSFSSAHSDVCIYDGVQVRAIDCARNGIVYRVSISVKGRKKFDWTRSKRLLTGSLLALSSDGFRNEILWATVARRDADTLNGSGQIDLSFSFGAESALSNIDKIYVAVESKTYFEAYSHMLKALQGVKELPFQDLLLSPVIEGYEIDGVPDTSRFFHSLSPPDYISRRPTLDIKSVDPSARGGMNVLRPWKPLDCSLDESQLSSLRHILTSEVAIVQGPPGTGKTFLGLKAVQIILDSFRQDELGPILCVCYTNHALDQFLKGIFKFEKEIVRVGSRSDDPDLQRRSLIALSDDLPRLSRDAARLRSQQLDRINFLKEEITQKLSSMCFEMLSLRQIQSVSPDAAQQFREVKVPGVVKFWLGLDQRKPSPAATEVSSGESSSSDEADPEDIAALEKSREIDVDPTSGKKKSFVLLKRRATEDDADVPVATSNPNNEEFRLSDYYDERELPECDPEWESDVWSLSIDQRRSLHQYWKNLVTDHTKEQLRMYSKEYASICELLKQLRHTSQLQILQRARVVGMTTTGAAKIRELIEALKPRVVIVEEAAEVLEASIITSISPSTEHLILIGDHQQLRPSVATFKMEKTYHLDVSMFERLIRAGVPYTQLAMQRRMRTNIASMISPIYPLLKTHPDVEKYPAVRGVPKNMFFIAHNTLEDQPGKGSSQHSNTHESAFISSLSRYLVQQGYSPLQITILTPYADQLMQLRQDVRKDAVMSKIKITTIDNYQGEENDVVLLSLVRSNNVKSIGFLKTPNRVCVALSRAKHGFYLIGNADLLAEQSPFWSTVVERLNETQSIGRSLTLQCTKHPERVAEVSCAKDFAKHAAEGGCTQPCGERLNCGHECTKVCHPYSHDGIKCWKPCARDHVGCGHKCPKTCYEECGKCCIPIEKTLGCGHEQSVPCHLDAKEAKCASPCKKILGCGHPCDKLCGDSCQRKCRHKLSYCVSECQHTIEVDCWILNDPKEKQLIACTMACGKPLICSHSCDGVCCKSRGACDPCKKPCENQCVHSKCGLSCGDPCIQCKEPCAWKCAHKECTRLCFEPCDRDACNEPCLKRLRCGHQCIGVCGERCPTICRICDPTEVDTITLVPISESDTTATFVQLDCGHVFESCGIDVWLKTCVEGAGTGAVRLPECPTCKKPVRRTMRFGAAIKQTLAQIEDVKPRILFKQWLDQAQALFDDGDFLKCMGLALKSLKSFPTVAAAQVYIKAAQEANMRPEAYQRLLGLPNATTPIYLISQALLLMGVHNKWRDPLEAAGKILSTLLTPTARDETADQCVFLAYAHYMLNKQAEVANKILDSVLQVRPSFQSAIGLKQDIQAMKEVVTLLSKTEGIRPGAWYQCRNGHLFVIGECGGAMETSKCPDCGAVVGGQNHALDASNSHVAVDGSRHAAWGDDANMANFDLQGL